MIDWSNRFAEALSYQSFLDQYASPHQRTRWDAMHERYSLTNSQQSLLEGFVRLMPVLCVVGAWCGDCINQCPVFDHFARAATNIDLRFIDRDANPELRDVLSINGGERVPVVIFLSEDWFEVSRYGDRTISTYRRLATEQLGAACSTGLIPPATDVIANCVAEWLVEFERAQLILRLSPRLRTKHND
jgi:thiol-disulfide isomerase/thioredoxin